MNRISPQIPVFDLYGERQGFPDLLHVERIHDRAAPLDWTIRMHRHAALVQVLWIQRGGAAARMDGKFCEIAAGECVFVPRLCTHGFKFSAGTEGQVVTVPVATLAQAGVEDQVRHLTTPRIAPIDHRFEMVMQMVSEEYESASKTRSTALLALVGLLATWLASAQSDGPAHGKTHPYDTLVATFLDALERGYRQDRSVAEFAAGLSKTPSHLNRACQQVLGKPVSMVIRERVMLEARRELAYTAQSVTEIALGLGFQDPAHFARVFRQESGQSPRDFRKSVNA